MKRFVFSVCIAMLGAFTLSSCTIRSTREAPVVDRSRGGSVAKAPVVPAATTSTPANAPSADDAEGTYVVKQGDTLYSIALAHGQDYRDIARWSQLDDPTKLRAGQVLRVKPPATTDASGTVVSVVPVTPVPDATTRPLDGSASSPAPAPLPLPETPAPPTAPAPPSTPAPTPAPTTPAPAPAPALPSPPSPSPSLPAAPAASSLSWIWPVNGRVIEPFHESRNKGIDIAAKEGDPVAAASDGQVVYSGNGLRGYGNLVIIKHSDDFISAYAHNKQILVKQGQSVKRGQRIAEVGKSDADKAKLHFEIRRQGKPIDPLQVLPQR